MTAPGFTTTVQRRPRGGVLLPIPFDPDEVWGRKERHLVAGSADGKKLRGGLERYGEAWALGLGPMWARDCGLRIGTEVSVTLHAEGPQRADLAPDLAAALDASPGAGTFWDALAQFYRKAYLRWIDGTKGRPEVRAQRIAEVVQLLERGVKQRPKG